MKVRLACFSSVFNWRSGFNGWYTVHISYSRLGKGSRGRKPCTSPAVGDTCTAWLLTKNIDSYFSIPVGPCHLDMWTCMISCYQEHSRNQWGWGWERHVYHGEVKVSSSAIWDWTEITRVTSNCLYTWSHPEGCKSWFEDCPLSWKHMSTLSPKCLQNKKHKISIWDKKLWFLGGYIGSFKYH